ncbi:MAG: WG repeat-containing protein [Prevotella sp.]|nr:WG repeat-containing protein [Prevotella sp.]
MFINKILENNTLTFDIDGKFLISDVKKGNPNFIADENLKSSVLFTPWTGINPLIINYDHIRDTYGNYWQSQCGDDVFSDIYFDFDTNVYLSNVFKFEIFDVGNYKQLIKSYEELIRLENQTWYYFNVVVKETGESILAISFVIGELLQRMVQDKLSKLIFDIPKYIFDEYPVGRFGNRLSVGFSEGYSDFFQLKRGEYWDVRVVRIEEAPTYIIDNPIIVAQTDRKKWIVLNNKVINDKKYDYISGFDQGYAIVYKRARQFIHIDWNLDKTTRIKKGGWGIIDTNGNEVLPLDDGIKRIWNFYGRGLTGTTVEIDNEVYADEEPILWFDFKTCKLLPVSQVVPAEKYISNVRRNELIKDWNEKLEDYRIESEREDAYLKDELAEARRDSWWAMTDGQYGDEPEGFDGDYSFLGE